MYECRQDREPAEGQASWEPGGHAKPRVHPIALAVGHDLIVPQISHEMGQTGRRVMPVVRDFQLRRSGDDRVLILAGGR